MASKELIVATSNLGKVKEVRHYIEPFGYSVKSLADFPTDGRPNWEETADTFEGNAIIKATALSEWLGIPVLADDSGLCVDALGGAPGVWSARYAGEHATDAENNAKVLMALDRVGAHQDEQRTARFVCALAWVDAKKNRYHTVHGICEGRMTSEAHGNGGFGYDPLFWVAEFGRTMAQLTLDQKNQISHRGQALRQMSDWINTNERELT